MPILSIDEGEKSFDKTPSSFLHLNTQLSTPVTATLTSFFNFVYEPDKSLINIIIEVDKDVLATNKKRVLTRAIRKACLEQWPQLADLQTKGVKIKISLVPIGTLPRRAAKLVDQARIKRY